MPKTEGDFGLVQSDFWPVGFRLSDAPEETDQPLLGSIKKEYRRVDHLS